MAVAATGIAEKSDVDASPEWGGNGRVGRPWGPAHGASIECIEKKEHGEGRGLDIHGRGEVR